MNTHISELQNQKALEKRVIRTDLLDFDYSKQRINDKAIDYLLDIPNLINLKDLLDVLFRGDAHNPSEDRAVSHTIYRDKTLNEKFEIIFTERERIKSFLEQNSSSLNFKNLICLSIGGSRLGPELLNEFQALDGPVNIYFCSSYDLLELKDILRNCNQSETLIFASSKSFETSEILKNLDYVKLWYGEKPDIDFYEYLYAISANVSSMNAYGIKKCNQFQVLDSLGGRFSIWSSISLPAFINSNFDSYLELLEGARLADIHTKEASWESNIPVMMALLSVWNTNSLNINNHGIFTYNFRLRSLTKYISQLSMESNGKSINFESKDDEFAGGGTKTSRIYYGGYEYAVSCSYAAGFVSGYRAKGFVADGLVNPNGENYPGFFLGERNIPDGTNTDNYIWYHGRPGAAAFQIKVGGSIGTLDIKDGRITVPNGSLTIPSIQFASADDGFFHDSNGINVVVNNYTDFLFKDGGEFHADADVIAFSTTISDERLKDEVKTIEFALDKINNLRGVEYVWNKGGRKGQKDLGVIAQEVEKVIPEVVRDKEMPLMDDSGETYKTVDYEKLTALLIEGVKEQQKQIDELKEEIKELKDGSAS